MVEQPAAPPRAAARLSEGNPLAPPAARHRGPGRWVGEPERNVYVAGYALSGADPDSASLRAARDH